jgi:FlaA1/EpsC-like NDP-sugar epimerase
MPAQRRSGLRTLIVGAGSAGRTLARDLRSVTDYGLWPVAFLDDDPTKRRAAGLPVVGPLESLAQAVHESRIEVVAVAIPSLPPRRVREIVRVASGLGIRVRYLPSFLAAVEHEARAADLRTLRIDHLLGRQEHQSLTGACEETLRNRRILVTGAGGSIGSELCRQIRGARPSALFLLDHDESNLHRLQLELQGRALLDDDALIIADIRDRSRVDQIIHAVRPDVIFHAAAHKHLPLLETHPCEGVKSNVLGTHNLIRAAEQAGVGTFILISTDKAADPRSVLGATKRLAEIVVQSYSGGPTRVGSVRFGNVLGSRGSFLSIVAEQVEKGEPVTVTHPEVTRFFMTVEEAVGLVLQSAVMAESGETFVLDMGEPVRIVDLVENFARQLNISDLTIDFTGLRPGEKLHEALFSGQEDRLPTAHPKVWATRPRAVLPNFLDELCSLYAAAEANDVAAVRHRLQELVPEYGPPPAVDSGRRLAMTVPYPDGF